MSKIYFASDFHLGLNARLSSKQREVQIVRWLEDIRQDAAALYLVGDLFDFWFEYQSVVPKGHFRLLAKLAELIDQGIRVEVFTGNHDMWMFQYLQEELGVPIHRGPISTELHGYKFIKRIFASPISQWLFARLHPNLAFKLAYFWSGKSRSQAYKKDQWHGTDGEWLISFCKEYLQENHVDYFIFGHRHLPINCNLNDGVSRYINLGDWLSHNSYAVMDQGQVELYFFENQAGEVKDC